MSAGWTDEPLRPSDLGQVFLAGLLRGDQGIELTLIARVSWPHTPEYYI
jgi:hypothetical protein